MQHGSVLTHEELCAEAHRLARQSYKTYTQIADDLGVSNAAVSKAVRTTGSKYQKLQSQIIQLETDYKIEEKTLFFVHETGDSLEIEKMIPIIEKIFSESVGDEKVGGVGGRGITMSQKEKIRKAMSLLEEVTDIDI